MGCGNKCGECRCSKSLGSKALKLVSDYIDGKISREEYYAGIDVQFARQLDLFKKEMRKEELDGRSTRRQSKDNSVERLAP
jgi:hypothetical protein